MHSIHFIAVKASDKEEAFDTVQGELSNKDYKIADWSDWHVVGGGRWSTTGSIYEDNDTDVISYDENPEMFANAINQAKEWRLEAFKWDLQNFKPDELMANANEFLQNGGTHSKPDNRFSMNYFYAKNVAEALAGYYTSNSHFYDLANHTTNMEYVLDNPKGFYLVPVDFHH